MTKEDIDPDFMCNECGHSCSYDDQAIDFVCPACGHDNSEDSDDIEGTGDDE